MPKLNLDAIPQTKTTSYPAEHAAPVTGRWFRRLAPVSGLTRFGVSHVTLKPGAWSSHRHWHNGEDEFVVMLAGEAVLVDDDGEYVMRVGDCASFPAGDRNGHHFQNRSDTDCVLIAVGAGDRAAGGGYSDIDMLFDDAGYLHRDGTRYPVERAG